MQLKFRLQGLAETFIDSLKCPKCNNDGGDEGDEYFRTDLSRVTYDGIIVVIQCELCGHIFVPQEQRLGIINGQKLRSAVEHDSEKTGEPILTNLQAVKLDVERLNAMKSNDVH